MYFGSHVLQCAFIIRLFSTDLLPNSFSCTFSNVEFDTQWIFSCSNNFNEKKYYYIIFLTYVRVCGMAMKMMEQIPFDGQYFFYFFLHNLCTFYGSYGELNKRPRWCMHLSVRCAPKERKRGARTCTHTLRRIDGAYHSSTSNLCQHLSIRMYC